MKTVLVPLPDRGFDVTEVAVPWKLLTEAGHRVVFATEAGATPECDPLLLSGVIFGQLGAERPNAANWRLATRRCCVSTRQAKKAVKAAGSTISERC